MKDNKYRVTSFRDEIFVDEKNIEEVIYRLNTSYEMMKELYEDSEEEIQRLHSIIKEVREYIDHIPTQPVIRVFKKELLEILDKENNNE